jgi:hypothetical protein
MPMLVLAAAAAATPPRAADVRAGLQEFLAAAAAEGFTGAAIAARGDTILLEAGFGTLVPGGSLPVTPASVFTTGSITKQFTATAILVLQERGRLSVQDSRLGHDRGARHRRRRPGLEPARERRHPFHRRRHVPLIVSLKVEMGG